MDYSYSLEAKAQPLFWLTSWFAGLSLLAGFWLWLGVGLTGVWLYLKWVRVVGLVGYNHYCKRLLQGFQQERNAHSHVWYRWFNEVPAVALLIVVFLVVLKPI